MEELSLSRVRLVQFVVSGADEIDLLLFCDLIREFPSRFGGIIDGISFYAVPGVNEQKIRAICVCFIV